MRTTLSIDPDVAALLERLRKSRDQSFKDIVNEALRRGLEDMRGRPKRREARRTRSVNLGEVLIGGIDNVSEVLAVAESEQFR